MEGKKSSYISDIISSYTSKEPWLVNTLKSAGFLEGKKKKIKNRSSSWWETLAIKNMQPIPSSVLLSSTGTPKRKQCKGLVCWATETIQALDPMKKCSHLCNGMWLQPAPSPWSQRITGDDDESNKACKAALRKFSYTKCHWHQNLNTAPLFFTRFWSTGEFWVAAQQMTTTNLIFI